MCFFIALFPGRYNKIRICRPFLQFDIYYLSKPITILGWNLVLASLYENNHLISCLQDEVILSRCMNSTFIYEQGWQLIKICYAWLSTLPVMKWYMRGNLSSMTFIYIFKNQSLIIEKMCINHFTITKMDKSTNLVLKLYYFWIKLC